MTVREFFGRVARTATERPIATIAVVGALALVGVALALQLKPSTSTDSLVGKSSASATATERFHRQFGDEAIVVLVRGPIQYTLETSDLGRLIELEGCLSGNVPNDARGRAFLRTLPTPCQELAREKPVKVVYGPGTFANTAANQIYNGFQLAQSQYAQQADAAARNAVQIAKKKGYPPAAQRKFANDARKLAYRQLLSQMLGLALRYGLSNVPSVNDPSFISTLFFDPTRGPNQPKPRFAYLVPSSSAALIQARLKPDLSAGERTRAIHLIEDAVSAPKFRLQHHQRYVVSGVPVVTEGLASAVEDSIVVLLVAALLVMAATLLVVFRTRRHVRLLPLVLALVATAVTYGALSLGGLDLTMASIAALPVLIGLAVDYAIQLQARFDENRALGDDPATAARTAALHGGPTIAGAALATAAGFLVLLLSPIPMVHGFALLVIVGIVLALGCALTAGLAVLTRFSEPRERPADVPPVFPRTRAWLARRTDRLAASRAGIVLDAPYWLAKRWDSLARRWRALLRYAVAEPRRVLGVALAVAVVGWVATTQISFQSDVTKLVPQHLGALKDVRELQDATGVSGEIDVVIRGRDLLSPAAVNWMTNFQQQVLAKHGYKLGSTCLQKRGTPELCPALSLTDLFRDNGTQVDAKSLLAAVPPYFSQAVISSDRHTANLAFGIRLMPLQRQKEVVDDIRAALKPPPGITAEVAGLPVLAADANAKLSSEWRQLLTLVAGLAVVFLVLLAIRRRASLAAIPLIPIALATGWSGLVLFVLGIELNPMTATLSALVIAISTEFGVLLSARYEEERRSGAGAERALEATYASTGAAVLASGATAIAGFAAVMASDIRMLRQFGAVTVVDLTVSLLGVMVVLPAALVWAERHGRFTLADLDPRPLLAAAVRGVRRPSLRRPPLRRPSLRRPAFGRPALRRPAFRRPGLRRPALRRGRA